MTSLMLGHPHRLRRLVVHVWLLVSSVLVVGFLMPGSARAQTGQEMALAEALFQEGRDLMKAGQLDEACPKLAKSMELDSKLGTLLNLAVCHQRQGKTATAWAEFTSARSRALREDREDRANFAAERVAELEGRMSYLVIHQASEGASSIALDGNPLTPAMLDTKLPVDPGTHVVSASGEAKKPWRAEVEVPPGPAEIAVTVPVLEDALETELGALPPPPPSPAPPAPAPAPAPLPPETSGGVDGATVAAWSGFVVGGAALVVGAITGGITLSKGSELQDACMNDRCPPDREDELDAANRLANVSNAMFAIAGVGVVVGVVGLLLVPGDEEGTASLRLDVSPTGVQLRGTF